MDLGHQDCFNHVSSIMFHLTGETKCPTASCSTDEASGSEESPQDQGQNKQAECV